MKTLCSLMAILILPNACSAQHGVYFDCHRPDPDNPTHLHHPHVDGVFLRWNWSTLEPARGQYAFSQIERDIAPWVKAGKKVLFGVKLAGQHNRNTPDWVYDEVDRIEFLRSGKNARVSVPKYWDARFLPAVSGLVHALGRRYGNDKRIEAVMIGVGHLGFLTAAPNAGGSKAFLSAGWTPQVWKQYSFGMIELYRRAFVKKPLFLRGSDLVLRIPKPAKYGFRNSRPFFNDVRDEILMTAATKYGVGVGCNGLEADSREFLATGIPALYAKLAAGARDGRYSLELSDDWPLWVHPGRRRRAKVDRGKDNEFFKRSLENAVGGVRGIPRLNTSWIKLLETDLDCTDPKHPDYQKDCEEKLIWFKQQLAAGSRSR